MKPWSGLLVPEQRVLRLLRAAERAERGGRVGKRLGAMHRYRLARTWGVHIHPKARVGDVRFPHPTGIVIGAGCVIEDDVIISQNVTIGSRADDDRSYPTIRRGARLYAGVVVVGPLDVGENAVVGANSLVIRPVPAGARVGGVPAKTLVAAAER